MASAVTDRCDYYLRGVYTRCIFGQVSVPLTLLGLLEREPSHGYDLKRDYDAYFGRGKQLPFGQVYSTLGRLARDGKVAAGEAEPGDGPDRKRYAITDTGRHEVDTWLAEPVEPEPHLQTILFAKVTLALMVSASCGAVLGIVVFLLVRPALAGAAPIGTQYFSGTVTPTLWGYIGMLVGVPAVSAIAALLSLRRVQISPQMHVSGQSAVRGLVLEGRPVSLNGATAERGVFGPGRITWSAFADALNDGGFPATACIPRISASMPSLSRGRSLPRSRGAKR